MFLLLALIALALAYVLPGHYAPWEAFQQDGLAIMALGFLIVQTMMTSAQTRVRRPRLAALTVLVVVVPGLQYLCGHVLFLQDALMAGIYLLLFAGSLCVGATLAASKRRNDFLGGLCVVFLGAGVVSILIAIMQWLHWPLGIYSADLPLGGRPFANFGQPNHLATLLSLMAMSILWLFEQRKLGPTASIALALFTAWGMAMTQSRTGWLFAVLLLLWWAFMHRRAALRTQGKALFAVMAAFAAMVLIWEPLNDALLLSLTTPMSDRLQGGTRLLHWHTLWQAIWLHPWAGWGWSQVGLAQQAAALQYPASHEWINNSHNLVLDLLVWNGVPLGLLFIAALTWWFVKQVRACRTPQAWCLLVGVGAIFTHAMLEFPLDYAYFLIPAGLLMGALDSTPPEAAERATLWRIPRIAFAVPALCLTLVCGWVAAEYIEVRSTSVQLRYLMRGFEVAVKEGAPPPDVKLLDSLRALHLFWLTPPDKAVGAAELERLREVSARYASAPAQLRYARIAAKSGQPAEAERSLGLLCKMHPTPECVDAIASWRQWAAADPLLQPVRLPTPEGPVNVPPPLQASGG